MPEEYNMKRMDTVYMAGFQDQFAITVFQRTYSTAEIEKTLFDGQVVEFPTKEEELPRIDILVVHGEMFELKDERPACPAIELNENSPLFDLISPFSKCLS
jgi:hypothetical protein